jgi:very-short-patch-repair endonuclease
MPKKAASPRAVTPKKGKCAVCGKDYLYVRKEMGLCLICQSATRQSRGSKWKTEKLLFAILKLLFKNRDYVINGYYSFLLSPKGQPLQLDWYCPELKIAFELQGEQHYKQVKYYQKSKTAFAYQQECDRLKRDACIEQHVLLLEIRTTEPIDRNTVLDKIRREAPHIYRKLTENLI